MQAVLHPLSKCVMCASVSCCLAAVQRASPAELPVRRTQSLALKNAHTHTDQHTKGDPLIISLPAPIV